MKGQMSMEVILISAFSMLLLLPIVYMFFDYTNNTTKEIVVTQAFNTGKFMADTGEEVYNYGEGAIKTIKVTLPKNIMNLSANSEALVINLTNAFLSIPIQVPMCISLTPEEYSAGLKKYRFENVGGYVLVTKSTN